MTDIEQIRIRAREIIAAGRAAIAQYGEAGAVVELGRATAAEELLALLDMLPARQPVLVADEVVSIARGVLGVAIGDAVAAGDPLDIERVAARLAERLAGRVVAQQPLTSPDRIPPILRQSLDDYAQHGLKPGHFLAAVLAGDLFGAMARADDEARLALPAIVTYVVSSLPGNAWGSETIVARWIARPRS